MPDFLTREELAKHLRRNSRTLDRWNADGIVPRRTEVGKYFIEIERSKVVGSATKAMASKAK
jgi:hypothetical protein